MKFLLLFFTSLLLFSCSDTLIIRENNSEDVEEAVGYARAFYKALKENDTVPLKRFIGSNLTWEKFRGMTQKMRELFGDFIETEDASVKTKVTKKGKTTNKSYQIDINVNYKKGNSRESLVIDTQNDTLKLTGYHFEMKFK